MTAGILLTVIGLVLIFDGVMPLAAPRVWRETASKAAAMRDGQIRFAGLASVIGGLAIAIIGGWL